MYNASLLNSAPCYAPRLSSSPRFATQGFVMYNATNAATWLTAPQRFATRLRVLRRASIQLNDLFVTPPLNATCLGALRRTSPQLNDLFVTPRRNVAYSIAALFGSTQRFFYFFASRHGVTLRGSARRSVTQLNDFFISFRASTRSHLAHRVAAPRIAPQRNDLFINLLSLRSDTLCNAALHGSTQRFVCYFATSRYFSQPNAAWRFSTQRFVYYNASPCIAPQHITLLRADQQRNATICLSIYYNAPFCIAPPRSAPRLNAPHQRNELKLN